MLLKRFGLRRFGRRSLGFERWLAGQWIPQTQSHDADALGPVVSRSVTSGRRGGGGCTCTRLVLCVVFVCLCVCVCHLFFHAGGVKQGSSFTGLYGIPKGALRSPGCTGIHL